MNFVLPLIQVLCCNRIPRSTLTDYFLDPKIMTSGKLYFDPAFVYFKISDQEFLEMRELMIQVSGKRLKISKVAYYLMLTYAYLSFLSGLVLVLLHFLNPESPRARDTPWLIKIAAFLVPNVALQCYWKYSMRKTCENIEKLFEEQNEQVYAAKGLNWLIHGSLLYIHLKIINQERQDFMFEPSKVNQSLDISQSKKKTSATILDEQQRNSNTQGLLFES